MKHFIATNWYRLITATAILIFACTVFVFAITNNVVKAGVPGAASDPSPANVWMVVKGNAVYEVTWDRFKKEYNCKLACGD